MGQGCMHQRKGIFPIGDTRQAGRAMQIAPRDRNRDGRDTCPLKVDGTRIGATAPRLAYLMGDVVCLSGLQKMAYQAGI